MQRVPPSQPDFLRGSAPLYLRVLVMQLQASCSLHQAADQLSDSGGGRTGRGDEALRQRN